MQATFSNLRYVPSEDSPDFIASDTTIIDFNEQGAMLDICKGKEVGTYIGNNCTTEYSS